eukprot:1797264-Alexandrium_andersonii.AAC.1
MRVLAREERASRRCCNRVLPAVCRDLAGACAERSSRGSCHVILFSMIPNDYIAAVATLYVLWRSDTDQRVRRPLQP